MTGCITDVKGLRVGHASDFEGLTGCTVVLMPGEGAVAGVDVRGAAPGTRETALLRPECMVPRINAVMFAGGSAFGLDAAAGVMNFLSDQELGFQAGNTHVPIVPAAIIFDLSIGDLRARPTPQMAREACENATDGPVAEGSVGAGVGATVGKILGQQNATKGGVGTASTTTDAGVTVAALAVVNAFGDIVEPGGTVLAGARNSLTGQFANTLQLLRRGPARGNYLGTNTTLVLVATDARLSKTQANRLAQLGHNGLARTIQPAHTQFDGDTIFAVSAGDKDADFDLLGALGTEVVARAVVRAVTEAKSLGGIPAVRELEDATSA